MNQISLLLLVSLIYSCNQPAEAHWADAPLGIPRLNQRNILTVDVGPGDLLRVNNERRRTDELIALAKTFIMNPEADSSLAESPQLAIIDLKRDHDADGELYLSVESLLTDAYQELWDDQALRVFGKPYNDDLPFENRRAIRTAIPMVLSTSE